MKQFYQFTQKDQTTTILDIFGDITSCQLEESDVGTFNFSKDLKKVKTNHLTVRINSYGGEVAEGLAIYNLLKEFGNVTTINEGFACSAASVIFMAGKKRFMKKESLILIHNAWAQIAGDSNSMKKMAEDLAKITQPSVEVYKSVSNLDEKTIKKMMDDETWFTADEALNCGFATSISDEQTKQSTEQQYVASLVQKVKKLENTPSNQWEKFFKNSTKKYAKSGGVNEK